MRVVEPSVLLHRFLLPPPRLNIDRREYTSLHTLCQSRRIKASDNYEGRQQGHRLNCDNLELRFSHKMGKLTTYRRIPGLACKQSFDVSGHRGEIGINKPSAPVEIE